MRPYKCLFCEQSFGQGSTLNLHHKKKHPEEWAKLKATGHVRPPVILPKLKDLLE